MGGDVVNTLLWIQHRCQPLALRFVLPKVVRVVEGGSAVGGSMSCAVLEA